MPKSLTDGQVKKLASPTSQSANAQQSRHVCATISKLDELIDAASKFSDAFRLLGDLAIAWRAERGQRQRVTTLLSDPTVTQSQLLGQKGVVATTRDRLDAEVEAARKMLDGLSKSIGDRLEFAADFETRLRRLLHDLQEQLARVRTIFIVPDTTFSAQLERQDVWGRAIRNIYQSISTIVFGDIRDSHATLQCVADGLTGKSTKLKGKRGGSKLRYSRTHDAGIVADYMASGQQQKVFAASRGMTYEKLKQAIDRHRKRK